MRKLLIFCIILSFAAFVSCQTEAVKPEIDLSQDRVDVQCVDGSGGQIVIRSNDDWSAFCPDSWVDIKTASGSSGETTFIFSVGENREIEPRFSRVSFRCGTATASLTVAQAGKDFISADKNVLEAPIDGGTLHLTLKTNTDYSLRIPSDAGWIHEVSTKTLFSDGKALLVDANPGFRKRSAVLDLCSRGISLSNVQVIQEGIEGNFKIEILCGTDRCRLPSYLPEDALGLVVWGDGHRSDMIPALEYEFTTPGSHSVEVKAADISSLHFDSLKGVEKITIAQ